MDRFARLDGIVLPLDRSNVDTDAIIPKQFLKSIKRTGYGPFLFDEWRYLDSAEPGQDCSNRPLNREFVLNSPRYEGAQILLARENFGCGSSREHAVWAIHGAGFRALIAPSFADIFYNSCFKNGILPVVLSHAIVDQLFSETYATSGYSLAVDLEEQTVTTPDGEVFPFEIDEFRRSRLLNGLDDIGITLEHSNEIRAYERRRNAEAPWLYEDLS